MPILPSVDCTSKYRLKMAISYLVSHMPTRHTANFPLDLGCTNGQVLYILSGLFWIEGSLLESFSKHMDHLRIRAKNLPPLQLPNYDLQWLEDIALAIR